jgi:uncharacterized protein (TIGR01777 family)
MRVAITGSSGLVGTALRAELERQGWSITRIVRGQASAGAGSVAWDPEGGRIDAAGLDGHDVVVHTAGEPIAGVWTAARKRRIEESRVLGTELLARTLASLSSKPALLISFSGVNYYGDRNPAEPMTEEKPPGTGFLARVCIRLEAATRDASEAGIRVVIPRLGNVLSAEGGMLSVLKPIFRLGLGAKFGSGDQIWPWIALEDVIFAILHVIAHDELRGPVNFVAPNPVTNAQFTRALARALHRPSFALPAFAAKLAPGNMAEEILLGGARVVPAKLLESGYVFRFPELDSALRAVV